MYKSCMEKNSSKEKLEEVEEVVSVLQQEAMKEVDSIVEDSVEMMLEEVVMKQMGSYASLLERVEPPFTPSTFTLWRKVALKRLRRSVLENERYRD